ncbi:MAG: LegC family aminotransferase [Clostridiales bacterium]|nr:LegC family aminotransferase [Clostridiales bacterium]
MKDIPLSVPSLSIEVIENIKECIETGWVSTGGRFISEFEKKIAEHVGIGDAVGVQCGTAGLHLALRALGVEREDEVIVPALTFIAAVNPVKYVGAEPVFMDCDESFCMDPVKLEEFCSEGCEFEEDKLINKLTKRRIKAIIIVHVFGNMADMENLMEIAQKYGLKVIEDATEALGTCYTEGSYKGKFAGTIGDIGVYSFNANKIITTGGGGMVVSENKEYFNKIRYLSTTAKDDPLYFIHDDVGYNYRMLNIQAAFGVSQADELEKFIAIKKRNYEQYSKLLKDTAGIRLLPFKIGTRPNYWFYSVYIDSIKYGMSRDELMRSMIDDGIQCRPVWRLVNRQKPYVECQSAEIEKALDYEANVMNLPCSVTLNSDQIEYVCISIRDLHKGATHVRKEKEAESNQKKQGRKQS